MLGVLLCAAALAGPEMIPEKDVDLVGRTAPDFTAQDDEGAAFTLASTRGKPVVLSFWASWCGPCRQELPALAELQKTRDDVVIYAVNVDRERAKAQKFLAQVKFDLPIVWDNNAEALGQYDVMSMPTMFLLDPKGTVKWRKTGFSRENGLKELEDELAKL
ncbi:MAG: TlpA family protein disulfide reductase [Alphaproteobacteria bacterium]|nr:TlpA family protein disulfide reductase [Alphaproteobacteria bacterium]